MPFTSAQGAASETSGDTARELDAFISAMRGIDVEWEEMLDRIETNVGPSSRNRDSVSYFTQARSACAIMADSSRSSAMVAIIESLDGLADRMARSDWRSVVVQKEKPQDTHRGLLWYATS